MSKPLDTRVVAKAKLGDIRLTLNVRTDIPGEGETPSTPAWCQMAAIDYDLVDADGANLGRRTLTHQTTAVTVKPSRQEAITAVSAELSEWVRQDKLAIANDEG